MVASGAETGIDGDEVSVSDPNKILCDANQMLIDLKNEIDRKNVQINSNESMVLELRNALTVQETTLSTWKRTSREELFSKEKMVSK